MCLWHNPALGRATTKLVTERFIWPKMKKECTTLVRNCIACQRSKIQRHNKSPIATFEGPGERFEHINIDIVGPLPISKEHRYILTIIDRFSRWPEAIPLQNITAESVARGLVAGWIARFGTPRRITTDLGRQFESEMFRQLNEWLGIKHFKTTPYHPQANGLIERWHRTVKAAIKCKATNDWFDTLPLILLGLRTTNKQDINASPADMTYGSTLRIPGEFFDTNFERPDENNFVGTLRKRMQNLRPTETANHSNENVFTQKQLSTCKHVFVRTDAVTTPFQAPYEGPFKVLQKFDKYFKLQIKNRVAKISVDRLKAAHMVNEDSKYNNSEPTYNQQASQKTTNQPQATSGKPAVYQQTSSESASKQQASHQRTTNNKYAGDQQANTASQERHTNNEPAGEQQTSHQRPKKSNSTSDQAANHRATEQQTASSEPTSNKNSTNLKSAMKGATTRQCRQIRKPVRFLE